MFVFFFFLGFDFSFFVSFFFAKPKKILP